MQPKSDKMKFNRESFEKAIKANHIVKYQVFFEDVVKSYLEIESQREEEAQAIEDAGGCSICGDLDGHTCTCEDQDEDE